MKARYKLHAAIFFLGIGTLAQGHPAAAQQAGPSGVPKAQTGGQLLDTTLEEIRARHKDVPGLAAAAVRGDQLVAIGVAGVRALGSDVRVQMGDCFHIGSCTKSMTAVLCGVLVERGQLSWDRTLAEAFPDLKDKMKPAYHTVTLSQLLNHRSGLKEDRKPDAVFFKLRTLSGDMRAQRLQLVEWMLEQPPAAAPGTKFQYSNAGYAIAGAMAEQAAQRSWEELMQELLFAPLGITSGGFGAPGSVDSVDQPRGHTGQFGSLRAMAPFPLADNPLVIGPAGTAHLSVGDWAKYASMHLAGYRKQPTAVLQVATFEQLYSDPFNQQYSYGLGLGQSDSAGGVMLGHAGSNGSWFARIRLAPHMNFGVVVAANCASEGAQKAVGQVLDVLCERFK